MQSFIHEILRFYAPTGGGNGRRIGNNINNLIINGYNITKQCNINFNVDDINHHQFNIDNFKNEKGEFYILIKV